jgi:hypothetical protein
MSATFYTGKLKKNAIAILLMFKFVPVYSPPTSAEVKKTWIYTSTPQYAFMA